MSVESDIPWTAGNRIASGWDGLHAKERHQLRYPSEDAVRFLAGLSMREGFGRLLDIGCGAGRHMKTAGEFGLDVTGVDISPVAVEQARQYGLALVGPMTDLPFADGEFDAAISWGVFYYSDRREMAAAFEEMRRVLRPGGVALVNVRTAGDWRTHFIKDGVFRKEGEPEDGMPITFLTFHDLQQLLAGWSQMSADLAEWTRLNRTYLNSDWMLQVMR